MKNAEGVTVKIADTKFYEITLSRAVAYKNRVLSPMAKNTVSGAMLKQLPEDAIADVKLVEAA